MLRTDKSSSRQMVAYDFILTDHKRRLSRYAMVEVELIKK